MNRHWMNWMWSPACCVLLAGCVTPPSETTPARPAPAVTPEHGTQGSHAPIDNLAARHREHAQSLTRSQLWADALVQWELLALLKPDVQEYRDAVTDTRKRIRDAADRHLRSAEQARRQGNLDQATLFYLRVLNVDRENAAASQALRDIDMERTLRAYSNRPPRLAM